MIPVIGAIASLFSGFKTQSDSQEESKVPEGLETMDHPGSKVTDLVVYPCRGAMGIHLKKIKITMAGFELDREWFVLEKDFDINQDPNKNKRFVSLTKNEELGVVACRYEEKDGSTWLVLSHKSQNDDLWIDINNPPTDDSLKVVFYNNRKELVNSFSEGDHANKWMTDAIGRDVILARCTKKYTADTLQNHLNYQWKEGDVRSAGHLKGALHIITQKSVDDLQTKIDQNVCKLTTDQFRPNIVVEGVDPWDEEMVREFEIIGKDATFRTVFNAKRCGIANYEIENEKRNTAGEPLKTLNKLKYLKTVGPVFGLFCQPDQETVIQIGDEIRWTKKTTSTATFE